MRWIDGRLWTSCLVAGGLLSLPAFAQADNPGKGDNKDDARSGKIDAKGDGNSGQGDDLHRKDPARDHTEIDRKLRELGRRDGEGEGGKGGKGPGDQAGPHGDKEGPGDKGRPELRRPDHDCERDHCIDKADRPALEELKKRLAALRDRDEVGEKDLGDLDACIKRHAEGGRLCPNLCKKVRQELIAECRERHEEREARRRCPPKPEHRCRGEKCEMCREYRAKLEEFRESLIREYKERFAHECEEGMKDRIKDHACEGEKCGRCGEIRAQLKREFEERMGQKRQEMERLCHEAADGRPGPLPPVAAGDPRGPKGPPDGVPPGRGPKGNNGVGNGSDPQPPGNPPVNDGPGTGRPGARRR